MHPTISYRLTQAPAAAPTGRAPGPHLDKRKDFLCPPWFASPLLSR